MARFLLVAVSVLTVLTPVSVRAETAPDAPCGPQDYDGEAPPDFGCPGPEEAALSVNLSPPRSVAVRPGWTILRDDGEIIVTLAWEGAVVHRDRLIEMGLRTKAVRRLRWADRLRLRQEYDIRLQHQQEMTEARIELIEEQRDAYQEMADQAREQVRRSNAWWRSPALWFAIGVISAGALVALSAWGLSAAGG